MPDTKPKPAGKMDLNRKVGPLPLWGWGAIAVGAFWAYRNIYSKGSGATTSADQGSGASLAPVDPYASYGGGGGYTGGGGGGGSNLPADTGTALDTGALPTTGTGTGDINITEPSIKIINKIPRHKRRAGPAHHPHPGHGGPGGRGGRHGHQGGGK
jgi:hypothetical protein